MSIARLLVPALAVLSLHDGFSQPVGDHVLPAPRIDDGPAFSTVLATRRSTRVFGRRALTDAELGQLLWAGQGVSGGHRTAPSAGALYPFVIHVVDARGVWRYEPVGHELVWESSKDVREDLGVAALRQSHIRTAPTVFVLTAELAISSKKYGSSGPRFTMIEAGHIAQNVLLQATALGLGAVPVGAFDEPAVRRLLALPPETTPLYLVAIGPLP